MNFHICIPFQSSVAPFVMPTLTCLLFVPFSLSSQSISQPSLTE